MTHSSQRLFGGHPHRTRRDAAAAWEHLRSAAAHQVRHVGRTSRGRVRVARERAENAGLALRGELPPSPWRWVGIGLVAGLAAGLAVGAAAATVRARARRETYQEVTEEAAATAPAAPSQIRETVSAGAEEVRERAMEAVQRVTSTARDAAADLVDRLITRGTTDQPEPTDAASRPPDTGPER